MTRTRRTSRALLPACLVASLFLGPDALGGSGRAARARRYVPATTVRQADTAPPPMLGSFYPAPTMTVRGDFPTGSGYSPLGYYMQGSMSVYGPLSSLRAQAAPVLTYSSGYDGVVRPTVGTSFSTPNLPELTPVVYPTRANFYGGFRYTNTPPWWQSSFYTIGQD